jgi:hypothetical protein
MCLFLQSFNLKILIFDYTLYTIGKVGATTESCPYKSGKYLPIIGDFMGCRGIHAVSVPALLKFLSLKAKMRIAGE